MQRGVTWWGKAGSRLTPETVTVSVANNNATGSRKVGQLSTLGGGGTHAGRTSAHSWMKGVGHELTAIPQKQSFVDPLEHAAAMSQSWLPQLLSAGPQQPIHP